MRILFENDFSTKDLLAHWFWLRLLVGLSITALVVRGYRNVFELLTGIYCALSIIYRFPSRWSYWISCGLLLILGVAIVWSQPSIEDEVSAYALSFLAIGAIGMSNHK